MNRAALFRRACIASALMAVAIMLAVLLVPRAIGGSTGGPDLEALVPPRFGSWTLDARPAAALVNPQEADAASQVYSQVLSRTYVDASSGASVMLSIAYGPNQTRSHDLHVPDICYPAGGFRIERVAAGEFVTPDNVTVPVRKLIAQRLQRREPLTYWLVVGGQATTGPVRAKLLALSYGLRGRIADGLVFRVSTVGLPDDLAFRRQEEFIHALFDHLPPADRVRLSGT
jgi:EpsI family protein